MNRLVLIAGIMLVLVSVAHRLDATVGVADATQMIQWIDGGPNNPDLTQISEQIPH